MRLLARKPAAPLDRFILKLWAFEGYAPAHRLERHLPDGSSELVINLAEDRAQIYDREDSRRVQRFRGALVAGPQTQYFVIDTAGQSSTMGVHFRPGGAFPFFGVPASELQNRHLGLDDLWGREGRAIRERILEARSLGERFAVLEAALLARAAEVAMHPAVAYALGEFERGPRTRTIAEVTGRLGLSPRRFIEVFHRQVGMTPKLFCRVRRFQRAVQTIAAGRLIEWAEVALDAGYFDQAHFINDFRAFSGLTPAAYAALPVRHPNHAPLTE